jgi:hypothetical protein
MQEAPIMQWLASRLSGFAIEATDGSIGSITDSLFDDHSWVVRWLVVDTGSWLPGRQVILPPVALGHPDASGERVPAKLTRKQVEESPGVGFDAPVSRQKEIDWYRYWGGTPYWSGGIGTPAPGLAGLPPRSALDPSLARQIGGQVARGDPRLRSTGEVIGYAIHASDGDIGHVADFVIDDEDWIIRYVIVDTGSWWSGKKVLVAPEWIDDIDWPAEKVSVRVDQAAIKSSPGWHGSEAPGREYERRLHQHYGYTGYWL